MLILTPQVFTYALGRDREVIRNHVKTKIGNHTEVPELFLTFDSRKSNQVSENLGSKEEDESGGDHKACSQCVPRLGALGSSLSRHSVLFKVQAISEPQSPSPQSRAHDPIITLSPGLK